MKALKTIKHAQRVVESLPVGQEFFVADIQRATGLDPKSLRSVLNRMLKNGHINKNAHGLWFLK